MSSAKQDWKKLERWLKKHAPRTHATLLPPIPSEVMTAQLGPNIPRELIELYGYTGGQSENAPKTVAGIFRRYWMMPLAGVDGLKSAFEDWRVSAEEGAEWATPNRFPFAKDFGGSYLCFEVQPVDPDDPDDLPEAKVVEIEDGECDEGYDSLSSLLCCTLTDLKEGTVVIDERKEERDERVVLFDATRVRNVGDAAKHSVFEELGITAVVGELAEVFYEKMPNPIYGLLVRLTSSERIEIDEVRLVDANDRPLKARVGSGSKSGEPGHVVWVFDQRPLPPSSRLKVTLARIRKV